MTAWRQMRAVARLDFAEVLRSRWLAMSAVVYVVLAGVFVAVGQREAPLLGFTGSDRVLFSLGHALILLLPLIALTATAPAIGRARDDGSLEFLFRGPTSAARSRCSPRSRGPSRGSGSSSRRRCATRCACSRTWC